MNVAPFQEGNFYRINLMKRESLIVVTYIYIYILLIQSK